MRRKEQTKTEEEIKRVEVQGGGRWAGEPAEVRAGKTELARATRK